MTESPHPLADVLRAAAEGVFPPADGSVTVLPPWNGVHAVVSFSAHAFLLTDHDPADVAGRTLDAYGGALHPSHQLWLAGALHIGSIDVVMACRARPGVPLPARGDIDDHARVDRAQRHRRDVRVLADEAGLVTVGRGLVDRWEVSVELFDGVDHGRGAGRRLIEAGLAAVPPGEWVWAQVAPGNGASVRAFLAAGFRPVCGEVLFSHHPD